MSAARRGIISGAAYAGSRRGMIDGSILIEGSAGNRVGAAMRRGLIAVGANCGDAAGLEMIAGSIVVFGLRPGAGGRHATGYDRITRTPPARLLPDVPPRGTVPPAVSSSHPPRACSARIRRAPGPVGRGTDTLPW